MVEILVAAEVDLNLVRGDGATVLFLAAQYGHHEVVKILVKAGADLNLAWGETSPLFLAAQNGHHKVVEILVATEVDLKPSKG